MNTILALDSRQGPDHHGSSQRRYHYVHVGRFLQDRATPIDIANTTAAQVGAWALRESLSDLSHLERILFPDDLRQDD